MNEQQFDAQHLLTIIDEKDVFQSDELARQLGVDHQRMIGAIKSLQTQEGVCPFVYSDTMQMVKIK